MGQYFAKLETMSGENFNQKYAKNIFCKIFKKNEANTLLEIDDDYEFYDIEKSYYFLSDGDCFAYVSIPDDATVTILDQSFKTDSIELSMLMPLTKFPKFIDDTYCVHAVKQNGMNLRYINYDHQTYELCKLAVSNCPASLDFVNPDLMSDELEDLSKIYRFLNLYHF